MGTPLYMSPEQIEGRPVDSRSDIYSLGVTSYHLLTGAPPHTGDTALAIAMHHLKSLPRPLENVRGDIPSGLARVIHRMIAKRPENRYQGPGELLADLRKLAGEAAAEGWGESADAWSLAEWIASSEPHSPAAAQLSQLMQTSAKLAARERSPLRAAAIVAGSLALGALAAWLTWPRPYLAGPPAAEVVERDSAWAQLFHAKMAPSEAAWQAVWEYWPNEDAYIHDLAREGLVRYYLELSQDPASFRKARQLLVGWIPTLSPESPQRAFACAALVVASQRLGRREEAREAASQLTSDMNDFLRRSDDRIYELLQSALRQIGD
jgi:serine/threonine-protein kinase